MKTIIVGKTASGKDYLKKRLMERGLKGGLGCTTRPPRPGEINGTDYIFLDDEQFEDAINRKMFIEYQCFNGWYYGTLKDEFDSADVMIMNADAINQLDDNSRNKCMAIYLDIDYETRKLRLAKRKDNNDSIERRMDADEEQFKNFTNFDLRVTNPKF